MIPLPQFFSEETALFAIDWLRGGIPVERETSVLAKQKSNCGC